MSRSRRLALALLLVAAVAACGGDERPDVTTWGEVWERRQALVPDAAAVVDGGQDLCGERLGVFRTDFPDLLPSPAKDLDAAVEAWAAHAETLVFECPTEEGELEARYETLEVLAAEVDAGLAAEGG